MIKITYFKGRDKTRTLIFWTWDQKRMYKPNQKNMNVFYSFWALTSPSYLPKVSNEVTQQMSIYNANLSLFQIALEIVNCLPFILEEIAFLDPWWILGLSPMCPCYFYTWFFQRLFYSLPLFSLCQLIYDTLFHVFILNSQ